MLTSNLSCTQQRWMTARTNKAETFISIQTKILWSNLTCRQSSVSLVNSTASLIDRYWAYPRPFLLLTLTWLNSFSCFAVCFQCVRRIDETAIARPVVISNFVVSVRRFCRSTCYRFELSHFDLDFWTLAINKLLQIITCKLGIWQHSCTELLAVRSYGLTTVTK